MAKNIQRALLALVCCSPLWGQSVLFRDDFLSRGRFEYRTLFEGAPERTTNWAAKITDLPNGGLLLVWCSTAGAEVSRTNRLWMAYSGDEGASWTGPQLFVESDEDGSVLNPSCYRHTDGTVFIFYNRGDAKSRFDVVYKFSKDSGRSWSSPTVMPVGEPLTSLMSNPILLRDGTVLFPLCYDRVRKGAGHYVGTVMLSDDGGHTWKRGGDFDVKAERGAMEPSVVELSDGQLYCLMRTKTGYQYETRSLDGGRTWSQPRPSPFPAPESSSILTRLKNGHLIFVWNNNTISQGKQTPRYPLSIALSEDDGRSWPFKKMIETTFGQAQLSNHGVFQTASGEILVVPNHFQGMWGGAEWGRLEQARFDETWIRDAVSQERWEAAPAGTGGVRLDPDGLLLVSGASGEPTVLSSKFLLPRESVLEFETGTTTPELFSGGALFVGEPGERLWNLLPSSTVRVELRQGLASITDSRGSRKDEIELPKSLAWPARWGFVAAGTGKQSRLKVVRVSVHRP